MEKAIAEMDLDFINKEIPVIRKNIINNINITTNTFGVVVLEYKVKVLQCP